MPDPSVALAVGIIGAALGADLLHGRTGRLPPLAVGRQVPQQWGRLFSAPVTALLYGSRLGVGPLTILSTWLWWAFTVMAGLLGPLPALAAGATFGLIRMASTLLASWRAERSADHDAWFRRLRSRRPWPAAALNVGAMAAVALVATGCVGGGDPELAERESDQTSISATTSTTRPEELAMSDDPSTTTTGPGSTTTGSDAAAAESEPTEALAPQVLSDAVIPTVAGFAPVTSPQGDRFLDLAAAAAMQPDPTEEQPLLETRGFQGGWTRAFLNDTQDVVIATVYEFADPTEAAFYLEDGLITITGHGGELFEIEEFPEARGFRQESADDIGPLVSFGISFTDGPLWYLVFLTGDPQTATPDIVIAAAQQQAALADLG